MSLLLSQTDDQSIYLKLERPFQTFFSTRNNSGNVKVDVDSSPRFPNPNVVIKP